MNPAIDKHLAHGEVTLRQGYLTVAAMAAGNDVGHAIELVADTDGR